MNLGKNRVAKNTVLIVVATAILGMLSGAGLTYAVLKDDLQKNNSQVAARQEAEARVNQLEDNIPTGSISPTAIANKPEDYKGKEVKVRGRLVMISSDKYVVAGQEKDKPGSIIVDVAKNNINPDKFISGYTNPGDLKSSNQNQAPESVGAVTITGTIDSGSQGITLTALKIDR